MYVANDFGTIFGDSLVWILVWSIAITLLSLGSSLFLAFCVYNDAKYRQLDNAAMWAVLSGFFNIVALIYLIVQLVKKPQTMRCIQCGEFLTPGSQFCARCGRPLAVCSPEQMAVYNKRRKLHLWLFIASYVVIIIATIVFVSVFLSEIFGNLQEYQNFQNY